MPVPEDQGTVVSSTEPEVTKPEVAAEAVIRGIVSEEGTRRVSSLVHHWEAIDEVKNVSDIERAQPRHSGDSDLGSEIQKDDLGKKKKLKRWSSGEGSVEKIKEKLARKQLKQEGKGKPHGKKRTLLGKIFKTSPKEKNDAKKFRGKLETANQEGNILDNLDARL